MPHETEANQTSQGWMFWQPQRVERWLFLCVFGAALVFLWTLAKPLRTHHIPTCGDLGAFHLPLREWYAQCLARGWSFDWMPGMYNGLFLTGEGEHGPYHPAHLLGYRFLTFDRAFALEAFAPFPLLLLGMFVFLRRHVGRTAAMLGALVYTFSANNLCHGYHVNYLAVMAHLPWLLWLIDKVVYAATPARRLLSVSGIGLLTGSQLLLGHPQAMSYSLLAEVTYACFLVKPLSQPLRVGLPLLTGKLLGVILGAVQLLATWEFMGNSSRTSVDPNFGSLPFSLLVQIISPALMRHPELGWCYEEFYFGMVPIILFLCWVGCCLRPRTIQTGDENPLSKDDSTPAPRGLPAGRLAWFALVLGVLAAWLATGRYGGLYSLQQMLPLVKHFRAPGRYINLLDFAAGILSAVVFARLLAWVQSGQTLQWRRLWLPWLGVGATLAVALAFHAAYPGADQRALARSFYAGPLLLLAAAIGLTLAVRGRALGLFVLLFLAVFDMNYFILRGDTLGIPLWRYPPTFAEWKDATAPPPRPRAGPVLSLNLRALVLMLHGERLVNGYRGGIEPRKYLDYLRPVSLRLAGAAWCCVSDREPEQRTLTQSQELRPTAKEWYEVTTPLPRLRLLTQVQQSADPARDIHEIDVQTTALVTHAIEVESGEPGIALMLSEQPGELRMSVDSPGRQILVLTDSYDPGWQVEIDGRRGKAERVNGDFLGCVLEKGNHEVRFIFNPVSIFYGRRLSLVGIVMLVLIAGASLAAQRLANGRRNSAGSGCCRGGDAAPAG